MTHYTSIEQSKHLLELGLSPETADMCYDLSNRHWEQLQLSDIMMACWSLGALIELLPERIHIQDWVNYQLVLGKHKASYLRIESLEENSMILFQFEEENLLDAVYQMVCILLEKGYIKKGE